MPNTNILSSQLDASPLIGGANMARIDRAVSMLFLVIYAISFYFIYRDYISLDWGYTGLRFATPRSYEAIAILFAIATQGWLMPQRMDSPSSVFIWMLTAIVYVPTMIITLMIGERSASSYYGHLSALSLVFFFASISMKRVKFSDEIAMPSEKFFYSFAILFTLATILLIYQYFDIIAFTSVEDVYFQRFLASDVAAFGFVGYLRAHYIYVFSSILFASGLLMSRYWYLSFFGLSGFLLSYSIDASKVNFVIPLSIIAIAAVRKYGQGKSWILNAGLAVLTLGSGYIAIYAPGAKLIADLVLMRSIAVPAQTFALYADVFHSRGYTWWSHVRGISLIIPPPQSFMSDPFWPVLGQIVGADHSGAESRLNLNANLFVGEGIAAAGSAGVIAIGLAMIAYLRIFDALASRWNQKLTILASVPLAMCLTNTHLSTLLLSFGGIFWLAVLHLYRPETAGTTSY